MTTYAVIRKSDGKEVYRYTAESAEPWAGMGFDTHDHVPQPEPAKDVRGTWEDPDLPAEYWQISVGSFKDRFDKFGYPGLKALILALGRHDDTCYAAFADLSGRDYVDLKERRAELLMVMDAIAGVIAAVGKPAFTPEMREAILSVPTTEFERFVKGLPQPE